MHKVNGVSGFDQFDGRSTETQFLDGLGHADHLKARIIGAKHHLMTQRTIDPGHRHILRDYGSTGGNPTGHIKAMLTGNHCHFPLIDGKLVKGSAQDIWFCEYDGPSQRTVNVIIQGD